MTAPAAVLEATIDRALCRQPDVDPELWFAPRGSADEHRARKLCAACPLRQAYTQAALDRRDRWGIWGGLDRAQRAALLAIPADERPPLPEYFRHVDRALRRAELTEPRRGGLKPCGTTAAARRHARRGEKPCEPCRVAHNAAIAAGVQRRRARKKASA